MSLRCVARIKDERDGIDSQSIEVAKDISGVTISTSSRGGVRGEGGGVLSAPLL